MTTPTNVHSGKAYYFSETLALTGDTTSTALDTRYWASGAIQVTWSGLTGLSSTLTVQYSNDGSNWQTVEAPYDDYLVTLSAASGTQVWIFTAHTARFVRLNYSAEGNTTGTATLVAEGDRKGS